MTKYLKERSSHESNLEEEYVNEAISTVTANDIFQKKTLRFDTQVKVVMESRLILIGINFNFMMLSKRGQDEKFIAIYTKFHLIIGNGDLVPASIFFNIKQTTLANWILKKSI